MNKVGFRHNDNTTMHLSLDRHPISDTAKNNMHIEYSKAKRYASILRIADYKKNEYLLDMYNKLYENGFIKDNDLSNIEFREYKILLFYSDTKSKYKFCS